MNSEELLKKLNQESEMNPDAHDGSYELMRSIIAAYSTLSDYSSIDYKDLNAVYAMAIGTWKLNPEKKKDYVNEGHLSQYAKTHMASIIDRVWDNACVGKYENREGKGPSIGMFGTGFYTFKDKADADSCRRFIELMVDISDLSDDDEMFDRCAQVFDSKFRGMQAASASVMLHCLKPNTFPILNSNFGSGTIYSRLGIELDHPNWLTTYIDNCRKIKAFRDSNLTVKNYRILDNFARKIGNEEQPKYFPSLEEYDPGITKEQYIEFLQDPTVVEKKRLDTLYYIYCMDGEATCTAIANKYGDTAQHYSGHATSIAKSIQAKTNCPLSGREDESERYWSVLFFGRHIDSNHFSWKLRDPLYEAIEELDEMNFFDYLLQGEKNDMSTNISLNTILYGPPGTGKTYNTVIYAVSIVEKKSFAEVQNEAMEDYQSVKSRFEEYKNQGRIAFTTFHQSYGYEEFIEGIKPVMDESKSSLEYSISDGVFKAFCDRASVPSKTNSKTDWGLGSDPYIWKISLYGTHDNPIRQECMENDHIRIGFSEYPEEFKEDDYMNPPLNAFYNKMEIGDIVLSCYTAETIDAIGVVTGEAEYRHEYDSYNRVRNVKWLVKGINENIVAINGGSKMVQSTVYQMKIALSDVLSIVEKYSSSTETLNNYEDNYVFVIDEINRGNISKIFGELITLVEESKRIGAPEEMRVKLPYSHQPFGVPKNVYLLGTMNTSDRSIAIMDTALRRRFSFVEMLPDSNVLRNMFNPVVSDNGFSVNVADMLDVINDRITFLYDREHTIGHAFFMPLLKSPTIDTLAMIFEKSIIPLLQEYFYEDYAKIQMVLGDDGKTGDDKQFQFISDIDMNASSLFEGVVEMEPEKKYSINYPAFRKIESYKKIAKRL